MREPAGPHEPVNTPAGRDIYTTPAGFIKDRPTELAVFETLHEIHGEQSRQAERIDGLSRGATALNDQVGQFSTQISHLERSIQEFGPKIDKLDDTYRGAKGAFWAFSISLGIIGVIFVGAATLLYWSNASRIDRLIKVLESPGIEKLIKKDGK